MVEEMDGVKYFGGYSAGFIRSEEHGNAWLLRMQVGGRACREYELSMMRRGMAYAQLGTRMRDGGRGRSLVLGAFKTAMYLFMCLRRSRGINQVGSSELCILEHTRQISSSSYHVTVSYRIRLLLLY